MTRRAESVIQRLFVEILHGTKGEDGKLPSAADLATEYEISTASVREALKVLESIGVVTLAQGRGILVEHQEAIIEELLDARILLERRNARQAAKYRDERAIARFRDLDARLDDAYRKHDIQLYSQADYELHVLIGEFDRNRILRQTLANIRTVLLSQQIEVNQEPSVLTRSHADHIGLIAAIVDGDVDRAGRAMENHLLRVRDRWCGLFRESVLHESSTLDQPV